MPASERIDDVNRGRAGLRVSRRCCWLSHSNGEILSERRRGEIKSYPCWSKPVWKSSLEPRERVRSQGREVTTGDGGAR